VRPGAGKGQGSTNTDVARGRGAEDGWVLIKDSRAEALLLTRSRPSPLPTSAWERTTAVAMKALLAEW